MVRFAVILSALAALVCSAAWADPPTVGEVVTAAQRDDASKLVDIYYELSDPDSETVGVRVKVSSDGGNTYNIIPVTFEEKEPGVPSDVGENVPVTPTPTQKHIVWDAGEDMPYTFGDNFRVAVTAHDCAGYTGVMIPVPAGGFWMGNSGVGNDAVCGEPDEFPKHWVEMSEYQIGKYEVTRGEYRQFILAGGYENPDYWSPEGWHWRAENSRTEPSYWAAQQNWGNPPGTFSQTDRHPVAGVSYYEAEAFCNWATACAGSGPEFHLPTEAQWEKAARWTGSHPNVYPWGDEWSQEKCNNLHDTAFPGCQTAPVGWYTNPSGASPYLCHDMAGNVWEWCKDKYQGDYYSQTPPPPGGWIDPLGPATGSYQVVRGGSWNVYDCLTRCADRSKGAPIWGWSEFGFRVAR